MNSSSSQPVLDRESWILVAGRDRETLDETSCPNQDVADWRPALPEIGVDVSCLGEAWHHLGNSLVAAGSPQSKIVVF